ncbi:MAG: hypothetical protein Fur003_3840 [Candidatus Dojkabacteria bacterium]
MNKAVIGTTILLILTVATYFGYTEIKRQEAIEKAKQEQIKKENSEKEEEEPKEEQPPIPITIMDIKEEVTSIGGQYSYIKYPLVTNQTETIKIILYSHGSITFVTNDFTDPFMLDMRKYGDFFSQKGYVFAASNEHGANWGSTVAVNDMKLLKEYITTAISNQANTLGLLDYKPAYEIYLVGYSMGGLPTMNYTTTYPTTVKKVALLAPTIYLDTWNKARFDKIASIPVKIWHGNKDVNVPWSLSNSFVSKAKSNGKTIEFITLQDKTHWNIHTEYFNDILTFFNE